LSNWKIILGWKEYKILFGIPKKEGRTDSILKEWVLNMGIIGR